MQVALLRHFVLPEQSEFQSHLLHIHSNATFWNTILPQILHSLSYSLLLTMKYFDTESKTTLVLFCSNGSLWTLKETPNSQQIQPKAQERGRDKDMGRQMSSTIQWLGPWYAQYAMTPQSYMTHISHLNDNYS